MVALTSLWLPILLSAVFVFIVSSVIHMFLKYHESDYQKLPNEDQVAQALRPFNIPPGDYAMPKPANMADMKTPEYQAKLTQGPVALMTVMPNGPFPMGKQLGLWFVYCAVVGLFAGYVASRSLGAGAEYLDVFQITGTVAFVGFGLATIQEGIWSGKSWGPIWKHVFDSLIYGLFVAGTFGWLWPA